MQLQKKRKKRDEKTVHNIENKRLDNMNSTKNGCCQFDLSHATPMKCVD